jgi:hypothetical protein
MVFNDTILLHIKWGNGEESNAQNVCENESEKLLWGRNMMVSNWLTKYKSNDSHFDKWWITINRFNV